MSSRFSTTDPRIDAPISVGKIHKPHGVRGEVVVESFSDLPARYEKGSVLTARPPEARPRRLTVASARPHRRGLLVRFDEFEDRDVAEELRGAVLTIDAHEATQAPEGGYFHYQLLGCTCSDRSHGPMGTVTEVLDDGGGQILVVGDDSGDWLVPFVKAYLVAVDPEAKTITFDLPEGLLEACRSGS